MDPRRTGFLLCFVAAAGFGSGALFAKGAYEISEIGFLTLMLWRFLLGAGATWLWIAASAGRRAALRATSRRTVAVGIGLGVLYFASSGTYYASLETVPASLAALIVFITPPVNAVLSLRFGRRLEGRRAWAALAIALAGGVLAVGGIPDEEMPPIGSLVLIILAPVIYSIWILIQSWLTGERSRPQSGQGPIREDPGDDGNPVVVAGLVNSGAFGAYLVATTLAGQPHLPPGDAPAVWALIAGLGIISTFVAILGFTAGTQRIGAATAALVSTVEPVWTIAMSALLLGESLTGVQLTGGALIIAGVLLAQSRRTDPTGPRILVRIAEE